ncbi:unnamed protein product [Soboliphyme baturini]|uniref:Bestrophin homolog n=1 Tax=Soboliphyme baturini TaxID=241478 RepID=A0A183IL36_9BILA|nr:unnamed protein product [Soboliphyme baturini]
MTVNYTYACANSTLSTFTRLLCRWKGSIYKIVIKDTLIFLALYYVLHLLYTLVLSDSQQKLFHDWAVLFTVGNELIPITFVLGFFVSQVAKRWIESFMNLPWPDKAAFLISCHIPGEDEHFRMLRRTMIRYVNLSMTIVLRDISTAAKKLIPCHSLQFASGFLTELELRDYERLRGKSGLYLFWLPLQWAATLMTMTRNKGTPISDYNYTELVRIRTILGRLVVMDWITLPLVYTQVVTIAVYGFFAICLMSRQVINDKRSLEYLPFPFFTMLQFLFYMGWLKVAEVLMNPFGEDDDDFEYVNYIIDRNLELSYMIVDDTHNQLPKLVMDTQWLHAPAIPYTLAAMSLKRAPFKPSAAGLEYVACHLFNGLVGRSRTVIICLISTHQKCSRRQLTWGTSTCVWCLPTLGQVG